MKFNVEYKYSKTAWGADSHIWTLIGKRGGVHFWTRSYSDSEGFEQWSGGVEIHTKEPYYQGEDAPHHTNCWLLQGPCWHDGSSLLASETYIPAWLKDPHNHEAVFQRLSGLYHDKFLSEESS